MAYCIKCGKELNEGAHYCYNCGHPVGAPLRDTLTPAGHNVPTARSTRQYTEEELEELSKRRLSIGRGILSLLVPPAGIAFTIVHYATHRPRAGRQALICTIIGFAVWTVLYILGIINDVEEVNTLYDDGFDWYEL